MSIQSLVIPTYESTETHTAAYHELRELAHQLAICRAGHIRIYTQSTYLHQNFSRYPTWRDRGWLSKRQQPIQYVELWQRIDAVCTGRQVEMMTGNRPYRLLAIGSEVVSGAMLEYAQRLAQIAAERSWQIVTGHSAGFEEALIQAAVACQVEVIQPESLTEALALSDRAICVISSAHPERDNIIEVLMQYIQTDVLDFAATF